MYEIDRLLVLIRPTQHFVEWANSHAETSEETVTLDQLQTDCTAILIPPFEDDADSEEYIEDNYLEIFENELAAWFVDEAMWPENRTLELFKQFFALEYHSIVLDSEPTTLFEEELESATLQ